MSATGHTMRSAVRSVTLYRNVKIDILYTFYNNSFVHEHKLTVQVLTSCRNVAARCPEHRLAILDEGAEDLLRAAGKHQGAVDEAYAALRDLQCEVEVN